MFFFKPKQHWEEILPPPPPFPDMGFSDIGLDQDIKKPALVDTAIKQSIFDAPDVKEFGDLMKDLDKEAKQKKPISKKEKSQKKALAIKKEKAVKEEAKKREIAEFQKLGIEELKLGPQEELEKSAEKGIGLPEELGGLDTEDFEKELNFDNEGFAKGLKLEPKNPKEILKPKEILEAEEEIKSAIEKIKKREKTSFLGRLLGKKEKMETHQESWNLDEPNLEQPKGENLISQPAKADSLSTVQDKINNAREALTNFDLRTAKTNYIEIMKIYTNMKPEEQAKVYHDIRELYFERKSAEGLKI